ncbi:MAG: xylose isomerase-like enzyme [Pseudonocardiales bacterium]|nr:xylose isomerase-like enzyme [Pseudonocardiales bacterium]
MTPINPRIAVNTMGLAGSALDDDCDWVSSIGVARISIDPRKLDAMGWAAGVEAVRRSGLDVATVVNPVMFTLDDPTSWPADRERGLRLIDAAAALQADSIYGVTGPPGRLTWEDAAAAYRDAVDPMRERAAQVGVRLAIESTNPLRISLNLGHSLRDTVEIAELAGVSTCIDIYGCFAEAHLGETIRRTGPLTAHVQLCDFVYGTLDTPNRAVPGDGDLPLMRILGWILEGGYTGAIELELNGPRIDAEGHRAATLRGVIELSRMLDELGA